MIDQKDRDFINQCFDSLYQKREPGGNILPAKEPPHDPEDSGVPPEMETAGKTQYEGWVKWKMLDSDLDESEITAIENQYQIKFPNLFRAYLTTKFHLFEEFRNDDLWLMLPPVPVDNPLGQLRLTIEDGSFLIKSGFIPFGYYEDCQGVICFDARDGIDEDYPVIRFDHETVDEDTTQESLESQAQFLFHSFEELMRKMFL